MAAQIQLQNPDALAKMNGRIAEITGKATGEVITQNAGLFTSDASAFTPPFAKRPIKEGHTKKQKQGQFAVRRDIRRIFVPITRLRLYKYAGKKGNKLGTGIRKAARKGDLHLVETLLRKANIRIRGVIKEPDAEIHDRMRDRRGRVRKEIAYMTLSGDSKLNAYIKKRQQLVGLAKDGWSMALHGLGREVPPWVDGQSADGVFAENLVGDKPAITVGNPVPYIQWNKERIDQQAWNNRFRNTEKQLQALERWHRKKLREGGIQTS